MSGVVLLGTGDPDVARLATALGADVTRVPTTDGPGGPDWSWGPELDAWRKGSLLGLPSAASVDRPAGIVVAAWVPVRAPVDVIELDLDTWVAEVEAPLAMWVAALGVAGRVVADGGVVVAVAERPSPLDCAGHGPEAAVADAVEAIVRSLARSEGPRGVRVNMVTTPARTAPSQPVAPPPPLSTFPGTLEHDVAGAVGMLLGADATGLTGTVVHADAGRSWR